MVKLIQQFFIFITGLETRPVEFKKIVLTSIFSQAEHGHDNRWY